MDIYLFILIIVILSVVPSSLTCGVNEDTVLVAITFDDWPEETYWIITDFFSQNTILATDEPYDTNNPGDSTESILCIPKTSCAEFTINDFSGDGICCSSGVGSYQLSLNGVLKKTGGAFSFNETTRIGSSCPTNSPTVRPSQKPTFIKTSRPTQKPTVTTTPNPTQAPTATCNAARILNVTIWLDDFPEETSWVVANYGSNTILGSGGPYDYDTERIEEIYCLGNAPSCFSFTIFDDGGDGICCSGTSTNRGRYEVRLGGNIIASGSSFKFIETTHFGEKDHMELTLQFDAYADESRWFVRNTRGVTVASHDFYTISQNEKMVKQVVCLSTTSDCYRFTMVDKGSDGMCCLSGQGSWMVEWSGNVIDSGGSFRASQISEQFGNTCPTYPSARPTWQPTSNPSSVPPNLASTSPTKRPVKRPIETSKPTILPTKTLTRKPRVSVTTRPTRKPSASTSFKPTKKSTNKPFLSSGRKPTCKPTPSRTLRPTRKPTLMPSLSTKRSNKSNKKSMKNFTSKKSMKKFMMRR